ncbi:MAG: hypothetical protein JNL21_03045 [Myxococcales bacterium]|nr:hypothetical protein [Myxococcales bacterium]
MNTSRALSLLLALAVAGAAGCPSDKERAAPEEAPTSKPTPSATAVASASGSTSNAASSIPAKPPTLRPVRYLESELKDAVRIFRAEGGVLVAMVDRVGRLDGSKVEWLGKVPPPPPFVGNTSFVYWVSGKYPDQIDVVFSSNNGRAPMPTYMALTGKGESYTFAPGGGAGGVIGFATTGESTLMLGYGWEGYETIRVRGPVLARVPTRPEPGGCKPGEVQHDEYRKGYAVVPDAYGASEDGTVILVGMLCGKRSAAEVWDKDGKSKIHELGEWLKETNYNTLLLHGAGDVSWIVAQGNSPILQYHEGKFAPLPVLPNLTTAFVSSNKVLHAVDGQSIYRYADGAFTKVADVVWPDRDMHIEEWGGTFYATVGGTLHRLEPAEPITYADGCKTPFVYLYDVSPKSEPNYSFPTTRKALATFDKVADIQLLEFVEGVRRLGIKVPDAKTGEAVIAHVRASMKDENPALLCYEPKTPRIIDMKK